ncbi:Calx-beta domain-containing protein, partial [Dokdonella immobilis]
TITINDDAAPEGDETVSLTLGAPSGGATLGVPSTAILTILANDAAAGTLQFTPNPADQTVAENAGTASFTVTRSGGASGAISTTIALGGSATLGAGNDYTTSTLTLDWADGDASDRTVTITVNDDAAPEGDETVSLTLGAPSGGATLGVPSTAILTILANDAAAGSLQFTPNPADQTVAENAGTATFTVTRSGGASGAISTTIALGGSATLGAGNDYTTSTLTLDWADGDASDRTVTITINDDAAPEGDETVSLTLGAPSGGAVLGSPSLATLTIIANDAAAGVLRFAADPPDQVVVESVGTVNFMVSRGGGSVGAISATVALGGSAILGSDYTSSNLVLDWADGDATDRTITLTVIDDSGIEGSESVALVLGAPSGGAVLGTPATANLTILDNDANGGPAPATAIPASSTWSLALLALLLTAFAVVRTGTAERRID